ncbi:mechanosensitive channel protein [Halomonas xinjiangensis]|uniref:mechanosensitive channel protein n=1 Tax=Litchfieldella xinjiangensis TaxID=1166948 RepID=UPI0005BE5060
MRPLCLLLSGVLMALMLISAPTLAQQGAAPNEEPPAYATLADLLEDPEARDRLISELRDLAGQSDAETPLGVDGEVPPEAIAAQAPSDQTAEEVSLPRRLAEATSNIAGDVGSQFNSMVEAFGTLVGVGEPGEASRFDVATFSEAAINLALVIVATFALFLLFRRLAKSGFTRISRWSLMSEGLTPVFRLVIAVAFATVIDVIVVALAYVAGNMIATFAIGESGELSTQASLFLNAFLIIELLKAGLRMMFASRYEGLRLLPITAGDASYWNGWIARLIGMVGYGLLVLVPLINYYISPTLGQGVGTLIMLAAFVYAVAVVLKNRLKIRHALEAKANASTMSATRLSLRLFARVWHWLAILYFLIVLIVTLVRPEDALPFVMIATLKTLAIIIAGLLVSSLLTQTIGRHIRLSDDMRRKLPLLEPRLNAYVPNALRVLRAVILIVVIMAILSAWGAFDMSGWYASEAGRNLTGRAISVAVILIVAIAVWLGLASLIEHRLNPETGKGEPDARTKTLLSLFRNALAITIITLTVMIVLSEIGINIGPLIAGAGVLGLAIGFGAQKLVQDIITGVFIQVENAMNTGDVVTVGGITGTAERLSIRSVGIRDLAGTYHIVPFSSVDTVSNYMRGFGNHIGEYGIAYRENIDHAIEHLQAAFDELQASEEHSHKILAPLTVAGVTALADSSVNIRVVIKTTPGDQWGVGRAYNRLVKMHFDAAGIEIPFPHTTLYFGENKDGTAPPAHLRLAEERPSSVVASQDDAAPETGASSPTSDVGDTSHNKPDEDDINDPQDR